MCTHNQYFRAKKKNIINFLVKMNIFTAVKYCCILHGRVCVMATVLLWLSMMPFINVCFGAVFGSFACR